MRRIKIILVVFLVLEIVVHGIVLLFVFILWEPLGILELFNNKDYWLGMRFLFLVSIIIGLMIGAEPTDTDSDYPLY